MTGTDLVLRVFLQLAVLLMACRVAGWLGRKVGQAQVVSEMVAGVVLGPSLFGLLAPGVQGWLFPKTALLADGVTSIPHPSMAVLFVLSQIALVLYMFLVGIHFDPTLLVGRLRGAGLVSASGIFAPLVLGGAAAIYLRDRLDLFAPEVSPFSAALYLGAAMSITAFPMLARIIYEKGITKTRLGTLALAAGSSDDVCAWCLLAVVLAFLKNSPTIAVLAIGGGLAYGLFMVTAGRRLLGLLTRWTDRRGGMTHEILSTTLAVLMLCAWVTDAIGIYAVFGAFIAGAVMPRGRLTEELGDKLGMLTTTLFLPVFFVYSGLNTQIGLLNTSALWVAAAGITFIAIVAKGVACLLAARVSGESWRDAIAIGTLMNARGLMELIILNIGLQQGVITPTLFTIMVLMAIVTTLMASPLFDRVYRPPLEVAPGGAERAA